MLGRANSGEPMNTVLIALRSTDIPMILAQGLDHNLAQIYIRFELTGRRIAASITIEKIQKSPRRTPNGREKNNSEKTRKIV